MDPPLTHASRTERPGNIYDESRLRIKSGFPPNGGLEVPRHGTELIAAFAPEPCLLRLVEF
jgi:hypothetical protein